MININKLKKIATGGQAEIFDLNNKKVLKLLFKKENKFLINYEFKSLKIAKQSGLFVPKVFRKVNIDGRPGLIMEKIEGMTMMRLIQRNPLLLFKKAKEFGEIHYKINSIKAPKGLKDLKERIRIFINKSTFIDLEKKKFILKILTQLPEGDSLCHGDFHPGNILIKNNHPYIIDWGSATRANPIADIADTYLLLKNVPRLQDESFISYEFMKFAGLLAAKTYLKSYNHNYKINTNEFSKWLLVRAAERTFLGMPSEKRNLVRFIDKCYKDYFDKKEEYKWFKFL